jgi:hypothetical protein
MHASCLLKHSWAPAINPSCFLFFAVIQSSE